VREHAGDLEAVGGVGGVVVVAALEVGVAHDGVPADGVEGQALRGEAGCRGQNDRALDALGEGHRPFERLLAAE